MSSKAKAEQELKLNPQTMPPCHRQCEQRLVLVNFRQAMNDPLTFSLGRDLHLLDGKLLFLSAVL